MHSTPAHRVLVMLAIGIAAWIPNAAFAQTKKRGLAGWPEEVGELSYLSTADDTLQPAVFYSPESEAAVPLLVGLHTWSGDYRQTSREHGGPYAAWCIEKGWAFIAPSFRGPNRRPEACMSELAVEDVLSAVRFVSGRREVDANRIDLVGVSGGGHAALTLAGRRPDLWAGVSAWVPIFDLADWHRECRASGRKYSRDLEGVTGGAPGSGPEVDVEYRRRSPATWLAAARNVPIDINAGIRDGHDGSVPISHSLEAFNALAARNDRIARSDIDHMTKRAEVPSHLGGPSADPLYGEKQPLFRRSSGSARVTIFRGGHEIVSEAALSWLAKQRRPEPSKRAARPLVGTRRQLLVDEALFEGSKSVTRVLGRPAKHGVVLEPELADDFIPPPGQRGDKGYDRDLADGRAPDGSRIALDFGYYLSVIWNAPAEKFQMWYMAWRGSGVGYAESRDGISWSRPLVGLSTSAGGDGESKTNIVHRGQGFSCFLDPTVPWGAPEKLKGASDLGEDGFGGPRTRVGLSYSADGAHWRHYNEGRPVSHRAADTHNQISWDPIRARYLLATRTDLGAGGGAGESRSTRLMVHSRGNDLARHPSAWRTVVDRITVEDPRRETVKWSESIPRLQLNATTFWIHEGVYFALFDVYSMDRHGFFPGFEYDRRPDEDILDFYLGASRDGVRFDRSWIHARRPFLPRGSSGSFDQAGIRPPSSILTVGDEHWIFYGGMNERHYSRGRHLRIGLAKLPRDRLIGFAAAKAPGEILTRPFRVEGPTLEVNVEAPRGEISVDVLRQGALVEGFSADDGATATNVDSIRWRPRWKNGRDLSPLLGEVVRLRFRLRDAALFAFALR